MKKDYQADIFFVITWRLWNDVTLSLPNSLHRALKNKIEQHPHDLSSCLYVDFLGL